MYFNPYGIAGFIEILQSLSGFNLVFLILLCICSFGIFGTFMVDALGMLCFDMYYIDEAKPTKLITKLLCGLSGLTTVVYIILLFIFPHSQTGWQIFTVLSGGIFIIPFLTSFFLSVAFVFCFYCIYKPIMAVINFFRK